MLIQRHKQKEESNEALNELLDIYETARLNLKDYKLAKKYPEIDKCTKVIIKNIKKSKVYSDYASNTEVNSTFRRIYSKIHKADPEDRYKLIEIFHIGDEQELNRLIANS